LGLGLNRQQQQAFQRAQAAGTAPGFAYQHPGIANRINRMDPTGAQAQAVQNFMLTGQRGPGGFNRPAGAGGTPQPPPSFAGPRGTQAGDQLTPYGMSQLGGMAGGNPNPFAGYSPGMQSVLGARFPGAGMASQAGAMGYQAGLGGPLANMGAMGGAYGYGGGFGGTMGNGGGGMSPWGMAGGNMGGGFGQYPQAGGGMGSQGTGGMYGGAGAGGYASPAGFMSNMMGQSGNQYATGGQQARLAQQANQQQAGQGQGQPPPSGV